jgi:hypothetical protein
MLLDRSIIFLQKAPRNAKVGAIIGVAGARGWEPFTMAMLSVFMFTCGVEVIDQAIFYAQGPGEILLDEFAMERARRIGYNLFQAAKRPVDERKYLGEAGACPVCQQDLFIVKDGVLECAVCRARAKLEVVDGEVKLVFDRETLKNHRWSEEMLREHLLFVLSSRPRFLKEKEEIRKRAERCIEFPSRKT